MQNRSVYLDYNATTPCDPRVVEAMMPFFSENFGNAASRDHTFGWQADEVVKQSREQVAQLIGASPEEIVFTSGATESDNLAIKGVFETYASKGKHIITAASEHKAVLDTCRHIEKLGADITYLPVGSDGLIDLHELEGAIRSDTILIAIMFANNETGVLQPIEAISAIAKKRGVLFFTDATQAVGKIPVDVQAMGIDLMALSAHKLYGPKGVGALYVRRKNPRVKMTPQMDGGGHENGLRSGTLNVPGIVGFAKACQICSEEMITEADRLRTLRDRLEHALLTLEETYINGNTIHRLPHVTHISFRHAEAESFILTLSSQIAVSSGAACSSASMEPSHVLKAMGISDELSRSSIRFSLGRFTTEEQIDFVAAQVLNTVNSLRAASPLWEMFKEGIYL